MFRSIVGLLLFILSTLGYTLYLKKRNIVVEFIPVIIFSSVIPILFIGGLLNILKLTILSILAVGVFLLLSFFWKNKNIKKEFRDLLSPGILFFLFFCLVFAINTRGNLFLHYDNFSHWALIVKSLGLTGQLPNFNIDVIMFNSYPPGSALFVYFFAKVVGLTEANAIFAQILLILACITTLFAWTRKFQDPHLKSSKKQNAILILTTVLAFYLFNGPTFMKDLLVDNLLLLFSVAAMNIIFYYFDNFKKALLLSLPLMASMLLIKNSGVIFIGINTLFLLASAWNNYKMNRLTLAKKEISLFGTIFLIPWFLFYLWLTHVKYVYPAGATGKHDMSIEYYKKIFSEKTYSDILKITKAFILRMFDFRNFSAFYELLAFSIVALLIALYIKKNTQFNIKNTKLMILGANILFLGYMGILWLMYLVSMPLGEAMMLASFDRYVGAIFNFLIVFIVIQIILLLISAKKVRTVTFSSLAFILIFLSIIAYRHQNYQKIFAAQEYPHSRRWKIDQAMAPIENTLLSKDRDHFYTFYFPSATNDSDYSYFYTQYKLFSKNVQIIKAFDSNEILSARLQSSDYLVVVEKDEAITRYIEEHQLIHEENGVYRIKK
ncbi:hypothetical protein [Candidatus Enterococcus lemimoniae]|uniref:Glycosyltransferase RgtA/B/C/D-like domain-containing protein n=1 Tax=Candidatus Enterococcus lemimoniae TaxID=1834167 RepID=A0ABZ2T9G0_9ENTE|nr:hypothetical protein [Enterococcus sp. 12C11_DIV0727]OTO70572.1 hypothetical protein A5866_002809 [Enterococcus sp. 12C11_DIV0727]